jgi:hypothetical protein
METEENFDDFFGGYEIEEEVVVEDNDNHEEKYQQLIKEYEEQLEKVDGGFVGKSLAYIEKRFKESPEYVKVSSVNHLGADANIVEISSHCARSRWMGSSVINGPAAIRSRNRKPKLIIKGLTLEQIQQINKNREDKNVFHRVM